MKKRLRYLKRIVSEFKINPVVAILGPRQCGKTTLALQYLNKTKEKCNFFDLENPEDLAALENPKCAFESLSGTIVIDEIQRKPELFNYLRVLVDKEKRKRKILILGSASRALIKQSSETLAGRISYIELTPFLVNELNANESKVLWQRGGFPLSFLSKTDKESFNWRKSYISTFLERDIPSFGIRIPSATLRRFWQMLSHYHGQIINYSEIGRSFGVADTTIRHYIDILTETFMIRQLQPWYENIKKRQVKRPKIYLRDSGIFHTLLTVENHRQLISHPKLGASWEGFAIEQTIKHFELEAQETFFWAVHEQGEIDLFFQKKGKRFGVEFKFTDIPSYSKSMELAFKFLKLHHIFCIYPGDKKFALRKNIDVCGINVLNQL